MASDYGLNFGFRRSDESMAVREGRQKTPVASALRQGTAVEFNPASLGYLKQSAASAAPVPGYSGILVQEDAHINGIYEYTSMGHDSFDLAVCKPNKLSVIWSGNGTKIWLKNTAAETRIDGRVIDAVTIVTATGLVVGDRLGWDGSKWVEAAGLSTSWAVVTLVNVSAGYVEAVLTF